MTEPVIQVAGLVKRYGGLGPGETFDFPGPVGPVGPVEPATTRISGARADPAPGTARAAGFGARRERDAVRRNAAPPGPVNGER